MREAGKVNMEDVTLEKNQKISPLKGHHVGPGPVFLPAATFGAVRSTGARILQTLRGWSMNQ